MRGGLIFLGWLGLEQTPSGSTVPHHKYILLGQGLLNQRGVSWKSGRRRKNKKPKSCNSATLLQFASRGGHQRLVPHRFRRPTLRLRVLGLTLWCPSLLAAPVIYVRRRGGRASPARPLDAAPHTNATLQSARCVPSTPRRPHGVRWRC